MNRHAFISCNLALIVLMLGFMWMTLHGAYGIVSSGGACFSYQCTPTLGGTIVVVFITFMITLVQTAALTLLVNNIRKALK